MTTTQEKIAFTPDRLERFQRTLAKYEQPASALLPTLWLAQEQWGFIGPPVLRYVAGLLGMTEVQVTEVVSFYFMFKKKDMGKYCLQVCNNITCTMMGSEKVMEVIREELGIGVGEVTADGQFSCLSVQCLGSCDTAPVVQVNEDYFENQNAEAFRALLRRWKAGEKPTLPGRSEHHATGDRE
jgi:NADH-quinone oxidoreductase E subunit